MWRRDGIGEFSEDLPALLVVLVAVALFVSGAVQAFSSFQERERVLQRRERVGSLLALLRSDPRLTKDNRAGLFAYERLRDVNSTGYVLASYTPARTGFGFTLSFKITGRGNRTENIIFGLEEEPAGLETVSLSSPCSFACDDEYVMPGLMLVRAWGFSH